MIEFMEMEIKIENEMLECEHEHYKLLEEINGMKAYECLECGKRW